MTGSQRPSANLRGLGAATVGWSVDAFTGTGGLSRLKGVWEEIFRRIARPAFYHFFEWHESYLESLEKQPDALAYYLISLSGRPVAIVPLRPAIRTIVGVRVKTMELPYHAHMPLTDVLCSETDTALPLLGVLARDLTFRGVAWDVLAFQRVLDHSSLAALLTGAGSKCVIGEMNSRCNYLVCGPNNIAFRRFSKNFQNNLRKAHNKLAAFDKVLFSSFRFLPDLESSFEDFLRVEASGWKGIDGRGTAIRLQRDVLSFYRGLIAGMGDKGVLEINLLKLDTECIAGQFSVIAGDTCYILKIGYREDFACLAPGNLLMEHTLRRLGEAGKVRAVNLITDASWHVSWAPNAHRVLEGFYCGNTPFGLMLLLLLRGKQRFKPVYQLMRGRLADAEEVAREKRSLDAAGSAGAAPGAGLSRGGSAQSVSPSIPPDGAFGPDLLRAVWMGLRPATVTIFMVHGLIDESAEASWSPLRTYHSLLAFKHSLRVLKKRFLFVPLATAVSMISRCRPVAKNTAVLTFDDGYRSVLDVMGFLEREDIVPTIFVTTSYAGTSRLYWWDRLDYIFQKAALEGKEIQVGPLRFAPKVASRKESRRMLKELIAAAKSYFGGHLVCEMERIMDTLEEQLGLSLLHDASSRQQSSILNWSEIKGLCLRGASIGSHTADHLRLSYENEGVKRQQLVDSKRIVEDQTGFPCEFLAYPSGDYDRMTIQIAVECGYKAAVTTVVGRNRSSSDVMRLKRINYPMLLNQRRGALE